MTATRQMICCTGEASCPTCFFVPHLVAANSRHVIFWGFGGVLLLNRACGVGECGDLRSAKADGGYRQVHMAMAATTMADRK